MSDLCQTQYHASRLIYGLLRKFWMVSRLRSAWQIRSPLADAPGIHHAQAYQGALQGKTGPQRWHRGGGWGGVIPANDPGPGGG